MEFANRNSTPISPRLMPFSVYQVLISQFHLIVPVYKPSDIKADRHPNFDKMFWKKTSLVQGNWKKLIFPLENCFD